ncbi:tail fiber domain-containing protein [Tenacibaculum agarivorans]|uniref:tail fiber domain-containing protein n=1 Tax=Tenacibaculum agarivorans TaxID=1908389 RepID=UPI00094B8AA0|nr:tail fiber domain-containing protein [Tenacibaculum agarivorans]
MSTTKDTLKTYFQTGDFPTEANFRELIDSFRHINDGEVIKNFSVNSNGDLIINLSSGEIIQINQFVLPSTMPVSFIAGLQNIIDNSVTIGQLNAAIATSAYGIRYSWENEQERNAQTGMKEHEQGVQKDTREVYQYTSGNWELFYTLDAVHNHDDRYYTEIESNTLFLGKTAKAADSDKLDGLDSSAFAKASHTHTWAQITGVPLTFPPSEHNHDDRYYTETESNALFLGKTTKAVDSDKLDGKDSSYFVALSNIVNNLTSTAVDKPLSAKQGKELKGLIDNINTLLSSNDTTLDEIQEIVNFIKQNKEDLENLGVSNISGLEAALSSKENTFSKNTAFNKNFGTTAGTVAQGNHEHSWSEIKGKPATFPATTHNHDDRYKRQYSQDITVEGDADKYYQVVIKRGNQNRIRELNIYRSYGEKAPATWHTATHKGGLTAEFRLNSGGWGGAQYDWKLLDFRESYSSMLADAGNTSHNTAFYVMLRGGGAIYHIDSDDNLDIQIVYNSTDIIFPHSNPSYVVYGRAPITSINSERLFSHKVPVMRDVLAKTGKAADSDKLDGIDSSGFVRKGIDAPGALNGQYLIFNFNDTNNVDAISFNDGTNAFYFNADRTKSNTTANANVHASNFYENGTILSSKYLGKTAKATDSDKLDGFDSSSFFRNGANNMGQWQLASKTKNSGYAHAALEVRELNFGGKQTGVNTEAPRVSFHWGGRVASQIMLRTDASIAIMNNPGTGYEKFRAADIYSNDALVATQTWANGAFLGKTAKATDSDKLDGYNSAAGIAANTIPVRDGAADIQARLFRSNYQTQSSIPSGATVTMRTSTSDNYLRHITKAGFLAWLGKVNDSNLLDGLDSTVFLRSNVDDSFSGKLTSTSRQGGIYGTYNSKLTDHIWSMGTAYKVAADGTTFGNLYGLAYKHTNNPTGGTMAGGHQAVWCENGVPKAAMGGDGLWSAEKIIAVGNITGNDIYANGGYYFGDNKAIIKFTDSWLRLNPSNQFTSGIYCATSILRTDKRLEVGSGGSAFYADSAGNGKFNNNLTVNGNIYGKSVNAAYSHLYRFGGLYFTWDSDTYGTKVEHSIRSAYGTAMSDSITINSYNNIRLNIDSNNNNGNSKFEIGNNTTGTTNVLFSVDETGTVRAKGDVVAYSTSDAGFKNEIKPIADPLMKINQLSGNEFKWNEKQTTYKEGSKDYGIIAQEVANVLPEAVRKNEDTGHLSVRYEKLIPLLIEGMKEQQEQIEQLKTKLYGVTN